MIRRNRTKRANFRGSPHFQATYDNQKKNKKKRKEKEKNAFSWDETGQNVQIFEEVLFFKLRTTEKHLKKTKKQLIHLACVS